MAQCNTLKLSVICFKAFSFSLQDTTDAKNVANTDMNQQIPMHAPVNPTEESALNFLQPTSKVEFFLFF